MPNKDGTGPNGQGPMTGQAKGPCNSNTQTCPRQGMGRGVRRIQGGGRIQGFFGRFIGKGRNRKDLN